MTSSRPASSRRSRLATTTARAFQRPCGPDLPARHPRPGPGHRQGPRRVCARSPHRNWTTSQNAEKEARDTAPLWHVCGTNAPRAPRPTRTRSDDTASDLHRSKRAGEGNRTLMTSLEGWGSAIELRPHDGGKLGRSRLPSGVAYRLRLGRRTARPAGQPGGAGQAAGAAIAGVAKAAGSPRTHRAAVIALGNRPSGCAADAPDARHTAHHSPPTISWSGVTPRIVNEVTRGGRGVAA